jgi:hypothetical protein
MAKLLDVIKGINYILINDTNIVNIVDDKIYPIGVPGVDEDGVEIKFPTIVMTRIAIDPTNQKICNQDICNVQLDIYATDYADSVDLASIVRESMEAVTQGSYNGVEIMNIIFQSATEGFDNKGIFVQSLIFIVK